MAEQMYVQVREERVRTTPSFLGKSLEVVHYGDLVSVYKTQNSWSLIEVRGQKGWLHISALSENEISLSSGHNSQGELVASDDELALAGKGFNKEVEEKFRKRNRNVSFVGVDRLETEVVSPEDIQQFVTQGELHPQEASS